MKRLSGAAALVAIVLAASACAGGHRNVVPPVPAPGRLVGSVRIGGGPVGIGLHKMGGLVVVYDLRGRVVERQRVLDGHNYRLVLRPGRYRLGLGKRTPEQLAGCRARVAQVATGATTRQNLWYGCAYY